MAIGLAIVFEPLGSNGDNLLLCKMNMEDLKACMTSINALLNGSFPSSACCSALSKADLQCFCEFKDSGLLKYLDIDWKLALKLPANCNISVSFHC
ncbi:hypothetical protein Pint_07540 [Pistacia integerrima]|uniref:Uncharacterized protein n=1 Tax=Pistacia integerrima TaxID=434235 RepID=A0ACC0XY43_9ROSI|nr:hypothetical protein Pint_07540 [Pistacia integerrima]